MHEHGAYTLMLDYYYADEKPLPLDKDELYTMLRAMAPKDRKAVDKILGIYFVAESDGYHQKRVDHEISVSLKARDNGKEGGRPRTGLVTGKITEMKTETVTGMAPGSGHPPTSNLQPPTTQPPAVIRQPPPKTLPPGSAKSADATAAETENFGGKLENKAVWAAYGFAYKARYGVDPVPNAKSNALVAQLSKRLPSSEAPAVASFYVRHNKALYVSSKHCLDLLVRDCEGLRTEWITGRTVTETEARQVDRKQNNLGIAEQLIAESRQSNASK